MPIATIPREGFEMKETKEKHQLGEFKSMSNGEVHKAQHKEQLLDRLTTFTDPSNSSSQDPSKDASPDDSSERKVVNYLPLLFLFISNFARNRLSQEGKARLERRKAITLSCVTSAMILLNSLKLCSSKLRPQQRKE